MLTYTWHQWPDLSPDRLYELLQLRSRIFVVEQNCIFEEMDGIDPQCEHLAVTAAGGELVAYLRLVPPGVKRPHSDAPAASGPAIGRVVVARLHRGTGLGRRIMQEALRYCFTRYPAQPVSLSGQQHLERFYLSLGFVTQGAAYLEDGIWHVDMQRTGILVA